MADHLLYLYAIVPAVPASRLSASGLAGIGGRPVTLVVEGDLAGVVSPVPGAEFDEEPLNQRLRDLDWLAPRAAAHQEVNARLLERDDALLPLAFGSVYRDEASLRRRLRERATELGARLAIVRGRAEWVVTVARDEPRALAALEQGSETLQRLHREIAASAPGRSYLLTRRLGDARRQEMANRDALVVRELLEGLGPAVERVYRESLAAPATGHPTPSGPIARISLLVERTRQGAFLDEVGRIEHVWQERGYQIGLTGPWPPYRFGGVPLEPTAVDG